MDAFQVPKKVNRHVLKAINILSSENIKNGFVDTEQIVEQVKYQMRNLAPVPNIDMVIQKSLENLSNIGLIKRTEEGIYNNNNNMSFLNVPAPNARKSQQVSRSLFKPGGFRQKHTSQLNPNAKRAHCESQDSLSGNEYDRTRKRMRTNNKRVNYVGRNTELPKARQHHVKSTAVRKPLKDPAPVKWMSYLRDNHYDNDLEMAVDICDSNADYILSNISSIEPLDMAEIFYDSSSNSNYQQFPDNDHGIVELYNVSKNFINDTSTTVKDQMVGPGKESAILYPTSTQSSKISVTSSKF